MRILIGILILLHGLVYAIMFALPLSAKVKADIAPFDPGHSWLLGERPKPAFLFALVVTVMFSVVASGLAQAGWWPLLMIVTCVASLVLLGLFASRYFVVGYLISVGLAAWAIWELANQFYDL